MSQWYRQREGFSEGSRLPLQEALGHLSWNEQGLIPVIAQQWDTGEVLMMAWMNRESLGLTLLEERMCYWSRSRQSLWRKGETSGNWQQLKALRIDCDGDCLLCLVDQQGPACHTGRRHCFYWLAESTAKSDGATVCLSSGRAILAGT